MADKIRWGIIGTGNIANQFAKGLTSARDAELLAVGSRSQETAEAFGKKYKAPRRYTSYEELAADPDVDAVYISTPHTYHKENTLLCLHAGKAVLCEKPFAINSAEAAEMIALAREKRLFLMEAMWTRYLPAFGKIRELLAEGVLGELRMVYADFGFRATFNPEHRLFNAALGGGALLDVGIYPVSLASMLFGQPEQILSSAHLGKSGVDEHAGMLFRYAGGQSALLSTAISVTTPIRATIMGTEGYIDVDPPFYYARGFRLCLNGKKPKSVSTLIKGNGYNYEAEEVGNCLRAGKLESDIMPLDETLAIVKTLDEIRAQWGLRYPGET